MTSREFRDRLLRRARKAGIAIPDKTLAPLETYFQLLSRWNRKINLTALPLDPPTDSALDRLFVEPLAAGPFVPTDALRWFDLGSGGGSPAIPIKILRANARLTMVESKARKAAFLREAARELGLSSVEVANDRFERILTAQGHLATADLITVRAVRVDDVLTQAASQALSPDGRLLAFSSASVLRLSDSSFHVVQATPLVGREAFLHILAKGPAANG